MVKGRVRGVCVSQTTRLLQGKVLLLDNCTDGLVLLALVVDTKAVLHCDMRESTHSDAHTQSHTQKNARKKKKVKTSSQIRKANERMRKKSQKKDDRKERKKTETPKA